MIWVERTPQAFGTLGLWTASPDLLRGHSARLRRRCRHLAVARREWR